MDTKMTSRGQQLRLPRQVAPVDRELIVSGLAAAAEGQVTALGVLGTIWQDLKDSVKYYACVAATGDWGGCPGPK